VLDDPAAADDDFDPNAVTRVVLCTGKVAYDALGHRDTLGDAGRGVAVVRVEQLYPWPETTIQTVLDRYPNARDVVWLQEEPENMGAWSFVHSRLHRLLRDTHTLRHVSRAESASPATGSVALHQLEQRDLLTRSIG
jgi:2-oxoglutarate dehydrogenase E1 component